MREPRTDEELLARLKAGDENAIRDVAEAYGSKIYQLAFRYLRNKEDAEEVTQDVLYKVHRKIDAFRGDAALSSWIYRITFNAAMSRLRTAKYQRAQNEDAAAGARRERRPDETGCARKLPTGRTWLTSACSDRNFVAACSARSWRFRPSTALR